MLVKQLLSVDPQGVAAMTKDRQGNLPIHSAAEKKNPSADVVTMLIDANPKGLEQKDRDGNLPIHSCLENRFDFPTSLFEKMLTLYPASTKVFDKDGNLPLHCAYHSYQGQQLVDITQLMLQVDSSAGVVKDKRFRQYLLHYICQQNKPFALIEAFCKGCPKAVSLKDSGGNLPLHVMCERGDSSPVPVIQCLMFSYPDGIAVKDKDGNTPLHSACEKLHLNISAVAGMMLDLKPEASKIKDRDGNLPLHSICESSTPATDVIMSLIEAYPEGLRQKDKTGNLPLHSAIERGDVLESIVLTKMIELHPEACKVKDKDGNTPLHSACECRTKDLPVLVKQLLSVDPQGVAAKTKDRQGNLPIHSACERTFINLTSQPNPQPEVVMMLIKEYPNGLQQKDKEGNLPIHSSVERGDAGVDVAVIEKMLELNPGAMSVRDKQGNTPLHSACECLTIKLVAVLTAMLRAGPNAAKVKDRDGNLPLHCVCESRKLTGKIQSFATDMLIDAYPGGLRVKDKQGNLPLHSAIERGNSLALNVLQKMVQIFPDACKATDKEKNTPLHSALKCRTKDLAPLVKLLLSADSEGVAVKTKDRDGQLPVHCTINMSKNIEQHDILCMLVEASPSCAKEVNPRDKKVLLQWALDRNALQVVASIARAAAETFEIKCCRVSSSSYPMFPLHYVCAHLPTVTIGVMQVVAKASSSACVTKDRQGKIPLRILHEEGSRPELIACVKKAMGPAAYNAIMFADGVRSEQVVVIGGQ